MSGIRNGLAPHTRLWCGGDFSQRLVPHNPACQASGGRDQRAGYARRSCLSLFRGPGFDSRRLPLAPWGRACLCPRSGTATRLVPSLRPRQPRPQGASPRRASARLRSGCRGEWRCRRGTAAMAAAVEKVEVLRTRPQTEAPSRSSASCSPSCSGSVAPASRAVSVSRAATAFLWSRAWYACRVTRVVDLDGRCDERTQRWVDVEGGEEWFAGRRGRCGRTPPADVGIESA